jgi:hypothetical protein
LASALKRDSSKFSPFWRSAICFAASPELLRMWSSSVAKPAAFGPVVARVYLTASIRPEQVDERDVVRVGVLAQFRECRDEALLGDLLLEVDLELLLGGGEGRGRGDEADDRPLHLGRDLGRRDALRGEEGVRRGDLVDADLVRLGDRRDVGEGRRDLRCLDLAVGDRLGELVGGNRGTLGVEAVGVVGGGQEINGSAVVARPPMPSFTASLRTSCASRVLTPAERRS